MRRMPIAAVICLLVVSVAAEAGARRHHRCDRDHFLFRDGRDVSIDFEDGELVIENDDENESVVITGDRELLVNVRRIDTDRKTGRLLDRYVHLYAKIEEAAEDLGRDAAKVGAMGAKIGIVAVSRVCRLLDDDYDTDDLDDDMEEDEERIERLAKKLEKKADRIEDLADDLKRVHGQLRRAVPELDDLDWF